MLKQCTSAFVLLALAGCATTPESAVPKTIQNMPTAQETSSEAPASEAGSSTVASTDASANTALVKATNPQVPMPIVDVTLPPDVKALNDRVVALMPTLSSANTAQLGSALSDLAKVREKVPGYVPAYLNAALILRQQKKHTEAIPLLDAALSQRANDVRVLSLKGLLLREQGQFNDAKAMYLESIRLDPAYASAHRNLAVLADVYLDEPVLALRHMEKYAELSPGDKDVENWLIELRRRVQASSGGAP